MCFSVDVNVQEWKVAFFFRCKLYLVVESIEVVQNASYFVSAIIITIKIKYTYMVLQFNSQNSHSVLQGC
jgi:hypothetical protein